MPSDRFSDADIVDRTLRLMRQPLAGFVQEMTARATEEGLADGAVESAVREIGYDKRIDELDTRILLKLMVRVWNPVFWDTPGRLGRSYATELHFLSNARAHLHDAKTFDSGRFVDTAMRLLVECGVDSPDELQALHRTARFPSEPRPKTEVEIRGNDAIGVAELLRERTAAIEERLAHLSTAVAQGNDVIAVLIERRGRETSETGRSEARREACTDPQARKIFHLLLKLGVNTADDDAVGDALDDRRFDGSLIKTWCQQRYTKLEAIKKIKALNRKVSESRDRTIGPRA